jgi:hypothetical protein
VAPDPPRQHRRQHQENGNDLPEHSPAADEPRSSSAVNLLKCALMRIEGVVSSHTYALFWISSAVAVFAGPAMLSATGGCVLEEHLP